MLIDTHKAMESLRFGDASCYFSVEDMWQNKYEDLLDEDCYGDFFMNHIESIMEDFPIHVAHIRMADGSERVYLSDGHHRFLAAHLANVAALVSLSCEIAECQANCLNNLAASVDGDLATC